MTGETPEAPSPSPVPTPAPAFRRGRVLNAVFNYGLGAYVPQLVNLLLVPLYSRYIPPAELGLLEIVVSAQALATIFMRMGLPGSVSRFYFDCKGPDELRDLVTTLGTAFAVTTLVSTAVAYEASRAVLARLFPEMAFWPYMAIALAAAVLQAAPELQRRLLQAQERSALYAKLSASAAVLTTGLTLALVVGAGQGALGILWAGLIVNVVYAVVAVVYLHPYLRGRFRREIWRQALAYGGPLVPHHTAAWAQQFAGRWVLAAVGSLGLTGQLGLAARLASPLAVVTGAFSSAYSPVYFSLRAGHSAEEAAREHARVGAAVLTLGSVAVVGAAAFGGWVVRYLAANEYAQAAPLVGVVAYALFAQLVYTLIVAELFYAKRTRRIAVVFITSAALNLAVVAWLAPRYGALGAALGQAVGGVVSAVIVAWMAGRSFPLPLTGRGVATALVVPPAACAAVFFLPAAGLWPDLLAAAALFLVAGAAVVVAAGSGRQLRGDLRDLGSALLRRGAEGNAA